MEAQDAILIARSFFLGAMLLFPVAATVLIGWGIYAFVAARRSPRGGWVARAYCAFIALGSAVWIIAVLSADSSTRAAFPALNPFSVFTPAVLCGVHLTALFRPRSGWLIFALALSAGGLVVSALLIALGLKHGPTPGQLLGFAIGGGLLWLTARASLARPPALDPAPDPVTMA